MRAKTLIPAATEYSMPLLWVASVAIGAAPAVGVLGIPGAIAFSSLATGWLFFGRILVVGCIGYPMGRWMRSGRAAWVVVSVVVDAAALGVTIRLDPHLLWSTTAVVIVSELFFNCYRQPKVRKQDTP